MTLEIDIPKVELNENKDNQKMNDINDAIQKINEALKTDDKKEISTLNDMLDKNFLNGITNETAQKIIKAIPEDLKNNSDVQKVIIVLSAKIDISGNDNNVNDISLDNINNTNYQIDLSNYKDDISGYSEKYGSTGLTGKIKQCLSLIGQSSDLQNLKNNLERINNTISNKQTKLNDLNKIDQFLRNNKIDVNHRTENDINQLLDGINKFLETIGMDLVTQRSANNILDTQEQKENGMSNSFSEFVEKIPNELGNLSKLKKQDIQNIKNFITESKSQNVIGTHGQPKQDVFDLYLKMYQCQQTLNDKGIARLDKNYFNEIFNCISDTFKNNEIQNYELGLQFKGINETNLQNVAPKDWNGNNLDENSAFVQTMCRGHVFKPEDYTKEFNSINEGRINNNIAQLKTEFKYESIFTKEEKGNFKIETSEDNKTILKFGETVLDSNGSNLVSTLGLEGKIKDYFNKNKGQTNFVNENEFKNLINTNKDIQKARYNQIFNKVEEMQKATQAEPTQSDGETASEAQPEELKKLEVSDIKNLRSKLEPETVAEFFNNAINKKNLTDEQKSTLLLAQKGLTAEKGENNDIKELQKKLGFNGEDDVDGKFGINTFRALKDKINNGLQSQNPTDSGVRERNYDNYSGNIETNQTVTISNYDDLFEKMRNIGNKTLEYSIGDDIKFSFKKDSCVVKKNNSEIRFKKEGNIYKEENPNGIQRTLGITNISITIKDTNDSGIIYYKTGHKFEGKIDSKGNPSNGTMIFPDKSVFEGTFYENGTRKLGIDIHTDGKKFIRSFENNGSSFGLLIQQKNGNYIYTFDGRNKEGVRSSTLLHGDYQNMNRYEKDDKGIIFYGKDLLGKDVSLQITTDGIIMYGTKKIRRNRIDSKKGLGKSIYKTLEHTKGGTTDNGEYSTFSSGRSSIQ